MCLWAWESILGKFFFKKALESFVAKFVFVGLGKFSRELFLVGMGKFFREVCICRLGESFVGGLYL